jgi:hypothetical protein
VTYPDLLSSLYREHHSLMALWTRSVDTAGEEGVFVFLPQAYQTRSDLKEVQFEFWTASRFRDYLRDRGGSDEGYAEVSRQVESGREFLVFIEEPPDAQGLHPVHIHRIGALHSN